MPTPAHADRSQTPSIGVVGAGPGGLASAMLLAGSGAKVTVYEAGPIVGGRTARVSMDAPGGGQYWFDRGPTFFMMPYVLEEVFRAVGRRLEDEAELIALDPMYRLLMGRAGQDPLVLDTTRDVQEMARRIGAIHEPDGRAFERFMRDNKAKLDAFEPILRHPMRGPTDLVFPEALGSLPKLKPWQTVHGQLGSYFEHDLVRLAVCFQSKYLGMSPYECPSLFTILPFIEYAYGIWHPRGGCHGLMLAMARVAQELGVEIRTDAPVDSIVFAGKKATGVVVRGERFAHDKVVVNADASHAMKTLIPENLRTSRHKDASLDQMRYSCSTYMLYLGVDGVVDQPHHTIYTSTKYQKNLEDITTNGTLSEDPSVYVCNPALADPGMAPEGKSALYVLAPVPNLRDGKVDWDAERAGYRERVLDQLEHVMGIERIRERMEVEAEYTPATWRDMGINFGATFNLAHNLGQMLHLRPQNKLKGVDGVFLSGGGTHPGSGLPTIFLSAQIAASLICGETGLDYCGQGTDGNVKGWEPAGVPAGAVPEPAMA